MSMTNAKRLVLGASVALAAALSSPAGAQSYPAKPITVIIPFAGGSASDVVSRIMFERMSKSMGQPSSLSLIGPPRCPSNQVRE